jgi:hypothetical protein
MKKIQQKVFLSEARALKQTQEQNRTEQNRTEQNRTEQNKTKPKKDDTTQNSKKHKNMSYRISN